jgi:beta-lactamase class A
MTVLDAVDKGRIGLDDPLVIGEADRSVFFQPVTYNIDEDGYQTTVRELLRKALIQSDNAANDKLISTAGGVGHVTAMLAAKNLPGIRLGANERELQAHVAGLTWRPELGEAGAFEAARAELPTETREAALAAYLANPMDGATPVGIVEALAAAQRGELLSQASTEFLISTMARARTGPRRLKGGLPEDWTIAHKTGTGQDWRGASVGINDVGLISAPDGRTYAVAVMLQRTHQATPQRLELMQSVSRAVVETWQDSSPRGIQTASAR